MNTVHHFKYYKILSSESIEELEEKVNSKLELNYELSGDLKLDKCPTTNKTIYIQVMINKIYKKKKYHWNEWE